MYLFKRMIDFFTLRSDRPIHRLLTYYVVLGLIVLPLVYFFPVVDRALGGVMVDADRFEDTALDPSAASHMLVDGLNTESIRGVDSELNPRAELTLTTLIILISVLALMLPVSWVYMVTRYAKTTDQQITQSLIFLPLVVAGVVLVVQNSLALAFSLAGVVAAVRFRSTLRDVRDVVFIFLAIAVGFAAGVQSLILATIVSVLFNVVLILTWRYDYGRSVLEPTSASRFTEPLRELARGGTNGDVPDRELVIALDQKQADALAQRFDRVSKLVGPPGKKPRYNAVLVVLTKNLGEAQTRVAEALDEFARRWRLDEVMTNVGKPSELCYLVRVRKSATREELLSAVHTRAGDTIEGADVQLAQDTRPQEAKA